MFHVGDISAEGLAINRGGAIESNESELRIAISVLQLLSKYNRVFSIYL